jgi:hypothetical protein
MQELQLKDVFRKKAIYRFECLMLVYHLCWRIEITFIWLFQNY